MTISAPSEQLLVGRPALIVVDIQEAAFSSGGGIDVMPGYADRMRRALPLVESARDSGVPVVFLQEAHRRNGLDFGRELDGAEDVHCLEGDGGTSIWSGFEVRDDEPIVVKRRYSAFFGTDFLVVLRAVGAETLVLCGGLTDVCVHYTFVDAHQHDFHVRVAEDAVAGSTVDAHQASLRAMAYLQRPAIADVDRLCGAFRADAARG